MALINYNPKYKRLIDIIGLCLFICITTLISYYNSKKIEINGGYNTEVIAIITSKSNFKNNRNTIHYKYQYNNVEYNSYQKNLSNESYQTLSVGDDIRIFINDKYPKYTKLDL